MSQTNFAQQPQSQSSLHHQQRRSSQKQRYKLLQDLNSNQQQQQSQFYQQEMILQQPQIIGMMPVANNGGGAAGHHHHHQMIDQYTNGHKRNESAGGISQPNNVGQYHSRNSSVGMIGNPSWDISGASGAAGIMQQHPMLDQGRSRQIARKGIGNFGAQQQQSQYNTFVAPISSYNPILQQQPQQHYREPLDFHNSMYSAHPSLLIQQPSTISYQQNETQQSPDPTILNKVERLERDLDEQRQLNNELINRILQLEQKVVVPPSMNANQPETLQRGNSVIKNKVKKVTRINADNQSIHLRNPSDVLQFLQKQKSMGGGGGGHDRTNSRSEVNQEEEKQWHPQQNQYPTVVVGNKMPQQMSNQQPKQYTKNVHQTFNQAIINVNHPVQKAALEETFLTQKGQDFFKQKTFQAQPPQQQHSTNKSAMKHRNNSGSISGMNQLMQLLQSSNNNNNVADSASTFDQRSSQVTQVQPQKPKVVISSAALQQNRSKTSNVYNNIALNIKKLTLKQGITKKIEEKIDHQRQKSAAMESKGSSNETDNNAQPVMETLITYEQEEQTPRSSLSDEQNSLTEKLVQNIKSKIRPPSVQYQRNQPDNPLLYQTVMQEPVQAETCRTLLQPQQQQIGLQSGSHTPELMEQTLLMQKIFNLSSADDSASSTQTINRPLQTPQTIVKGQMRPHTTQNPYDLSSIYENLARADHQLAGKKAIIPRLSLKSHFDSIRDVKLCCDNEMLVSVSEDCMVKLWDVKGLKPDQDYIEPLHTYRGHSSSLFAVTSNRTKVLEETLIYTAGQEGVIRIWKVPKPSKELYPITNGENQCIGIFTSHKDVVWQLCYHPVDNMLLSVSADTSVKLWKSFDYAPDSFDNVDQCTNQCLMGSFVKKRDSGLQEVPTSASWVPSHPNMLVISYRNPLFCLFDRVTGRSKGHVKIDTDPQIAINHQQINKIIVHPTMPLAITAHENKLIKLFDLNSMKQIKSQVAHTDAVTSLVVKDFTLVSGGHDSSLRVWDLRKMQILHEVPSHRRKNDESVFCLEKHPTKPMMFSGGADSTIKVYDTLFQ